MNIYGVIVNIQSIYAFRLCVLCLYVCMYIIINNNMYTFYIYTLLHYIIINTYTIIF